MFNKTFKLIWGWVLFYLDNNDQREINMVPVEKEVTLYI